MTAAPRRTLLVATLLVVAAGVGVVVHATHGTLDLDVYRFGGRSVLDGTPLYSGRDPGTDLPFTYPPFAALLLLPVALLPAWLAAALWSAATAGSVLLAVLLVRRAQGIADGAGMVAALVCAAFALEPVWQTFGFGQVNLFLLAAVLADLLRPDRRRAGVLVGIAAGIKLTPLVFVALLLLAGRRTEAGRAVAAFAATVAVGFVVLPDAAWTYWTSTVRDAGRVGGPAYAANQSVFGALSRLLGEQPPTWLWVVLAGPLALLALVVGARVWRDGDRVLGTCLGAVAMLLASPISWSHHWVWAGVVSLALLQRSRGWALAWTAAFVAAPLWWVPHGDDRELAWSWWQQLPGNAFLLAALVLVGWAVADVWGNSVLRALPRRYDRSQHRASAPNTELPVPPARPLGRGGLDPVARVHREHLLHRP